MPEPDADRLVGVAEPPGDAPVILAALGHVEVADDDHRTADSIEHLHEEAHLLAAPLRVKIERHPCPSDAPVRGPDVRNLGVDIDECDRTEWGLDDHSLPPL